MSFLPRLLLKPAEIVSDRSLGTPEFARPKNAVAALVGLATLVLTMLSIATRPPGTDLAAWRPAAGVTAGVASWYSPRSAWLVSVSSGVGTALGFTVAGRPLYFAIGAAFVAVLEGWIGSRMLRGRTGRAPSLSNWGGLRRLLLAGGAVGIVGAAGLSVTVIFAPGPTQITPIILSVASGHVLGLIIAAPVFFEAPPPMPHISRAEMVIQWLTLAVFIALTFRLTTGVPIAFLIVPPLVWGAARLPYRVFAVQLILAAATISQLTGGASGPLISVGFSSSTKALLSGLFGLTLAVLAFAIIVSSAIRRTAQAGLDARERFGRESIEVSLTGIAVVHEADGAMRLSDINPSGRSILQLDYEDRADTLDILSAEDAQSLRRALDGVIADPPIPWRKRRLLTRSGRMLEASLVALNDGPQQRGSLQFIDVTDRELLVLQATAERQRAVEIQRALVPRSNLVSPGYQVAGRSIASKSLGGDFYDWYSVAGGFALTLGDVMGKGTGASILAAALRTSLRLAGAEHSPAPALTRVADAIGPELDDASSFSTVFSAHIRAEDGHIRYADAGHGLALMCGSDGTANRLDSHNLPVGVLAEVSWTEMSAQLDPGDTLVIFSDGVLDIFDGSLSALDEIARMSAAAASSDALIDLLFRMVDPEALDDDVTIIVVRRLAV